jgi:DNA-binding PadR family transcriptional regulator
MLHENATASPSSPIAAPLTSGLRGALLSLLLEQSGAVGAYRLSSLMMQRLPAWQVTHSAVANLMKRLVAEGYARPSLDNGRTYVGTQKARCVVEDWMEKPLAGHSVREDLHARIATASPRHAPLLYKALDDYERECFEQLDRDARPNGLTPCRSWRSLTISLTRAALNETLHGNIRWCQLARQWISDWAAASGEVDLPAFREDYLR